MDPFVVVVHSILGWGDMLLNVQQHTESIVVECPTRRHHDHRSARSGPHGWISIPLASYLYYQYINTRGGASLQYPFPDLCGTNGTMGHTGWNPTCVVSDVRLSGGRMSSDGSLFGIHSIQSTHVWKFIAIVWY